MNGLIKPTQQQPSHQRRRRRLNHAGKKCQELHVRSYKEFCISWFISIPKRILIAIPIFCYLYIYQWFWMYAHRLFLLFNDDDDGDELSLARLLFVVN